MIVDASALLAVLLREPDAQRFADALTLAARARIPAPNWLEAAMVLDRRGDARARNGFDAALEELRIEVAPFGAAHAAHARQAWRDYGRGSGNPARLNFGDCLAYGFAKGEREPLLFKGEDFTHTDVRPALED
jgi:ribonuclease VapC